MPNRDSENRDDYQSRYFALLEDRVSDNKERLNDHDDELREHSLRLTDHDKALAILFNQPHNDEAKKEKVERTPFFDDPIVKKAIFVISLTVLILVAAAVNFDLKEVINSVV